MAWAEQLPAGNWRAGWRNQAGRRRYATKGTDGRKFTHESAAKRFANAREEEARRGVDGGATSRGLTWAAWLPRWLELRQVAESTARSDANRIARHILPRWGDVQLARITRDDVQVWLNRLNAEHSEATALRIYAPFAASLRAAVRSGKLAATPCIEIDKPTAASGTEHYLTWAEFSRIVYFIREPYRTCALLLAATGARFGEIAGLHWERVDLGADQPGIVIAETFPTGATEIKAMPKGKRARFVPLPSWAVDALVAVTPDRPAKTCGIPHAPGSRCRSVLVLTESGHPLDTNTMRRRHWAPACALAGVEYARLHDVRHSTASWWRQGGLDIQAVQELLGHAEIRTTSRYSHIGGRHIERAAQILEL